MEDIDDLIEIRSEVEEPSMNSDQLYEFYVAENHSVESFESEKYRKHRENDRGGWGNDSSPTINGEEPSPKVINYHARSAISSPIPAMEVNIERRSLLEHGNNRKWSGRSIIERKGTKSRNSVIKDEENGVRIHDFSRKVIQASDYQSSKKGLNPSTKTAQYGFDPGKRRATDSGIRTQYSDEDCFKNLRRGTDPERYRKRFSGGIRKGTDPQLITRKRDIADQFQNMRKQTDSEIFTKRKENNRRKVFKNIQQNNNDNNNNNFRGSNGSGLRKLTLSEKLLNMKPSERKQYQKAQKNGDRKQIARFRNKKVIRRRNFQKKDMSRLDDHEIFGDGYWSDGTEEHIPKSAIGRQTIAGVAKVLTIDFEAYHE